MNYSFQILLIIFTLASAKVYDVYRNIQKEFGYLEQSERHNELHRLLNEIQEDLDYELIEDAWRADKPPTYKGCEPMIHGIEPVKCPEKFFFEE